MKKTILLASAAALAFGASTAVIAAEHKSHEEMCKEQATKHKVPADKMDAYVKTCVEKHAKKKHKTHATTAPAAPAAPAAETPSAPAAPAK
jgi:hypothetical protein